MVTNIKYKVGVGILKFLKFKIPNFWNRRVYSSSSDRILTIYISLESSHRDASNDTKFMSLASILRRQIVLKEIYVFVDSDRNIDARILLLLPFDSSH